MDLVKLENKKLISLIPEEELNRFILVDLSVWVSKLLSLTDDVSTDRLEMALPAIKTLCRSMSPFELKKMFEMYADSQLDIKPIPNYFDRILFGKIVSSYEKQRVKPTPKSLPPSPDISENEKNAIMEKAILSGLSDFKENRRTINASSRFDWLESRKSISEALKMNKEEYENYKSKKYDTVKARLEVHFENVKINSRDEKYSIRDTLKELKQEKSGKVIAEMKKSILEEYYLIKLKTHGEV